MTKKAPAPATCPCGSGLRLADCCARWHAGVAAPDAERLMRSRYAAYVLGLADYLLATWAAETRPKALDLASEPAPRWLGLEVKQYRLTDPDKATVEFVARYRLGGRAHRLHETSRFVRRNERWFYVDGEIGA